MKKIIVAIEDRVTEEIYGDLEDMMLKLMLKYATPEGRWSVKTLHEEIYRVTDSGQRHNS